MEWHRYLREERTHKIAALMRFLSGDLALTARRDGQQVESSDEAIDRLRRGIAEIEQILTAAGVPLDDEHQLIVHPE